ncbi:amino acid/amide ABC transporter ATP-binding protein 2 (HAAT family) [Actinocorallia herbida]|uniref:Amino acid/amide ABC transporter ATP-binding protein 2 (HAAT family) n=1 Tax=Actinocorallia herbida TaxID=58109 RepID=A0A3N1D320_9ACTN|nr:ABC transporter ATP-binding protein [Actinocorallia herbida]ROO87890.1 amino acid/amide ABC transporter ATP-binding protein 2 (HAAT family) [Actinocorallia herbida]
MTAARLEVTGLTAGYSRAPVIRGIDLRLGAGEVLALLGPNGAGKSTTLLALSGLLRHGEGTVRVDGADLPSGKPRQAARQGLVLVPDDRSLFTTLTVAENLRLAAVRRGRVADVLDLFPRLRERLKVNAGALSGGEQQMLALGRALVQDPKVLLIDELSMGLAPVIVQGLLPVIRRVADETGTSVVLVEQHVSLALQTADTAVVLAHGEQVLSGAAADLIADPENLEAAYLGAPATPERAS